MTGNDDRFDENLKRMLQSAIDQPRPAFEERLVRDVLAEVCRQRELEGAESGTGSRTNEMPSTVEWSRAEGEKIRVFLRRLLGGGPWGRPLVFAAAASAVLLVAAGIWLATGPAGRTIGQVKCLYGLVAVQDNGACQTVAEAADLKSGQRIQTRAGSGAEIFLADRSKLTPAPRTSLQITRSGQGPRILLEQGTIQVEAAKQPAGKAIRIEAARAQIKVLGTRLEVRLVEKPSGTRQTRVRVLSGQVEMESGAQKVLLFAGTEGVADADQPPVRSSVVFEVNELLGLFNQTKALAEQSGHPCGLPAIFDLTTGTLWAVVPGQRLQAAGLRMFNLKLKYPAFRVAAYTLDGAEILVAGNGQVLRLDFSAMPSPQSPDYVILKVPGVGGLVKETAAGLNECALPGTESDLPTLLQFHLPESARLEQLTPGAVGTSRERNRLIVTVAARVVPPEVYE
jgi:hypothetical protein